eukprot:1158773-Pelagomonas_calceolata.AAC.25
MQQPQRLQKCASPFQGPSQKANMGLRWWKGARLGNVPTHSHQSFLTGRSCPASGPSTDISLQRQLPSGAIIKPILKGHLTE